MNWFSMLSRMFHCISLGKKAKCRRVYLVCYLLCKKKEEIRKFAYSYMQKNKGRKRENHRADKAETEGECGVEVMAWKDYRNGKEAETLLGADFWKFVNVFIFSKIKKRENK